MCRRQLCHQIWLSAKKKNLTSELTNPLTVKSVWFHTFFNCGQIMHISGPIIYLNVIRSAAQEVTNGCGHAVSTKPLMVVFILIGLANKLWCSFGNHFVWLRGGGGENSPDRHGGVGCDWLMSAIDFCILPTSSEPLNPVVRSQEDAWGGHSLAWSRLTEPLRVD